MSAGLYPFPIWSVVESFFLGKAGILIRLERAFKNGYKKVKSKGLSLNERWPSTSHVDIKHRTSAASARDYLMYSFFVAFFYHGRIKNESINLSVSALVLKRNFNLIYFPAQETFTIKKPLVYSFLFGSDV